MKVATASSAFVSYFRPFFPNLKIILDPEDTEKYDLIIFTGGEDINPEKYGEINRYSSFNSSRDKIEFEIFERAFALSKKILGVCRGHQLINVALGGTLYQDLEQDAHAIHYSSHSLEFEIKHPVMYYLPKIVNSMHHQGISAYSKDINIIASWKGIPEIITTKDNNILGVQFHPEFGAWSSFFNYIKKWATDENLLQDLQNSILGG